MKLIAKYQAKRTLQLLVYISQKGKRKTLYSPLSNLNSFIYTLQEICINYIAV